MRISKDGALIESVEGWFEHAPPKGKAAQWRDGRSAKELAKAWFHNGALTAPEELLEALETHSDTKGAVLELGEPEAQIRFDKRQGEPRNADLAIRASLGGVPLAITVEAKADESFGNLVSETMADALDRSLQHGRGGGLDRVRELATSLLPPPSSGIPALRDLRYQLLTAIAGTLAWAQIISAPRALLIIHEFQTTATSEQKLESNTRDLDKFVARLSMGKILKVQPGIVIGPIKIPGAPLFPTPAALYLAKVIRRTGDPTP